MHFLVNCCLSGLLIEIKLINLGQVRLTKGFLYPTGIGILLEESPTGLEHPTGPRNRKNTFQLIFNNPRSSIPPGNAPDPIIL